jgi:carbonic anhydrase
MQLTRRQAVSGISAILASTALATCGSETINSATSGNETVLNVTTADQALKELNNGNQRFMSMEMTHPHLTKGWRTLQTKGQNPFAIIFSCVDSRVPPEYVFDRGLGDLFVMRSAGHVLDNAILGSIEFGIEELHIPLVLVLGHKNCGAVKASIEAIEKQTTINNHIKTLVDGIRPSIEETAGKSGDKIDKVVRANISHTITLLKSTETIKKAEEENKVRIAGAYYDLDTGAAQVIVPW